MGDKPIMAVLDSYNPVGSTAHVRFNTSRTHRWQTDPARCHVNWVVLDSDWEAELCRVAEEHPRVKAYVKNHNLGLEVSYRYGSETRVYLPDFIVLVDDGRGDDDPLHLVVEIKGYRREDATEKAAMDGYWVPGVNNLGTLGRWAFAELREIYRIESDFEAQVAAAFEEMIRRAGAAPREVSARHVSRSVSLACPRPSRNCLPAGYAGWPRRFGRARTEKSRIARSSRFLGACRWVEKSGVQSLHHRGG